MYVKILVFAFFNINLRIYMGLHVSGPRSALALPASKIVDTDIDELNTALLHKFIKSLSETPETEQTEATKEQVKTKDNGGVADVDNDSPEQEIVEVQLHESHGGSRSKSIEKSRD